MTCDAYKKKLKKVSLFIAGLAVLTVGIALILLWWGDLVVVFRGVIGVAIALAALVMLFLASQ